MEIALTFFVHLFIIMISLSFRGEGVCISLRKKKNYWTVPFTTVLTDSTGLNNLREVTLVDLNGRHRFNSD